MIPHTSRIVITSAAVRAEGGPVITPEEIEAQTQEFLARGRSITHVPMGVSGEDPDTADKDRARVNARKASALVSNVAPLPSGYMSRPEVAAYLGISVAQVQSLVQRHGRPYGERVGNQCRYKREDVEAYKASGCKFLLAAQQKAYRIAERK